MIRSALVALLLAALAGCAAVPERRPVMPAAQAWRLHRERLGMLQVWTLSGHIAIRDGDEAWSASLHWSQTPARYRIDVVGPLGSATFRLDGTTSGVVLQTPKDGTFTASDPDSLVRDALGLAMPVNGLRYWILGLPRPGAAPRQALDPYGRLARLRQDGWQIDYRSYQTVDGLELPEKVFLSNERFALRIAVSEWTLDTAPAARSAPAGAALGGGQ